MPAQPEPDQSRPSRSQPSAQARSRPDLGDTARQLGELWAFGLGTSQAMAERVLALYQDLPSTARPPTADVETELRRLRIDLERAVDLSVDVFDRVLALASRMGNATGDAPAEDDDQLLVLHAAPGTHVSGVLWLHNQTDREQPAPELRSTDLGSFEGLVIPRERVVVSTASEPIAAWNSRSVDVTVDVTVDVVSGTYHGLVLAHDDGDTSFRVRVDVAEDVVIELPIRGAPP